MSYGQALSDEQFDGELAAKHVTALDGLPKRLQSDETVHLVAVAVAGVEGVLVATTRRLLFLADGRTTWEALLTKVSDVEYEDDRLRIGSPLEFEFSKVRPAQRTVAIARFLSGEPIEHGADNSSHTGDTEVPTGVVSSRTPTEASVPTKVCPRCAIQERTHGAFCPHCGASYGGRRHAPFRSHRSRVMVGSVLGLLLLAAGGGVAVKLHQDSVNKRRRDQAAAAAQVAQQQAQAAAAQQQAAAAQQQDAQNQAAIAVRDSLVKSLESSVTDDAKKDVANGVLNGPILRTVCTPTGGGNTDNLAAHTGNYSCLAVTSDHSDGTSSGYGFVATVNYDSGTYTWHLGNG